MSKPRPLSAQALATLIQGVEEKGVTAKVVTPRVIITIMPPPSVEPANPADLIEP